MGSINILLADDSITIRKVVGIIFGGDDYSLTMVDSGTAAIAKALEVRPDILLIDVHMPGMSGYEVCEAARREPLLAATPILLLTGSFDPFDEEKAHQCGANGHIVKPFEAQQLVNKVQELLAQAKESAAKTPESEPAFQEPVFESAFAGAAPAVSAFSAFSGVQSQPDESFILESTFQQTPAASPDDPWGAFTSEPGPAASTVAADSPFESHLAEQVPEVPVEESFTGSAALPDMPDVMEMLQDDAGVPAAAALPEASIGSSWIPSDEQTFEFREEVAEAPSAALGNPLELESQMPAPAPEFDPAAFEPTPAVEPVVETVAEVPPMADIAPAAALAGAPVLTEEQLKAAIMAASQETIERIVWEVVPDLAETMIREAIRKITEGK
jgi:CheY-like chemotaxis protein